MEFRNTIIYLIGFAGVGKRTIGAEICAASNFRLIDNHRFNNAVFPFVHENNPAPLPPAIWTRTSAIRKIALDTMVELGNRDFNYVFTNQLHDGDAGDLEIYNQVFEAAERMSARFIPVRLLCGAHEHKRRITSADRAPLYKDTSPDNVAKLESKIPLLPDHPNLLTLDVTGLSKDAAAQEILYHLEGLTP